MNPEFFYHASNIGNLTKILPLSDVRESENKACYFTSLKEYALFYLRDMEINHVTCGVSENGTIIYHEQFPNQLKVIYQRRGGYIYTCENNDNVITAHANGVWMANHPISVVAEEHIEDVYTEILKSEETGKIQIVRYELLSQEKKHEIVIMMKNYIIRNNLLFNDSAKARFWAENFPQSWKLAKIKQLNKFE